MEPTKEFEGHTHAITNMFFYKGLLYTGSRDCTVKQWEVSSGICTNIYKGHRGYISSLVCNKHGILFSGSGDSEIGVWSAEQNKLIRILKGHEKGISCLLYTEDHLYSGSFDGSLRKWENESGNSDGVFTGHTDTITTIKKHDDWLFSASSDTTVRQWKMNGTCLKVFQGHTGWVWDVAIATDHIYTASQDKSIRKWTIKDAKEVKCFDQTHCNAVTRVSLTRDNTLLSSSWDGTIKEMDLTTNEICKTFDHGSAIRRLVYTGRILITDSEDKTVRIWDTKTGQCLFILKNPKEITGICIGANFDIYVGCKDGVIRKFVLPNSKQYEGILDAQDFEQSSFQG